MSGKQNQLPMFMQARAISELQFSDLMGVEQSPGNKKGLIERKVAEVQASPRGRWEGPYDFEEKGITSPLTIRHGGMNWGGKPLGDPTKPMLVNGHHRLAWALHKNPAMELPVEHTDPMNYHTMRDFHEMASAADTRRARIAAMRKEQQ